jgi:hypothetical protein
MKTANSLQSTLAAGVVSLGLLLPFQAGAEGSSFQLNSQRNTFEEFNFTFGNLLSPNNGYQPEPTFATLAVSTNDQQHYSFTLTALGNFNSNSAFGSGAYISQAIFNTVTGADPKSTKISNVANGVAAIDAINNPPLASLGFDFGDCFNRTSGGSCDYSKANGKLQGTESVSWTAVFNKNQPYGFFNSPAVALQIQGFSYQATGSKNISFGEEHDQNGTRITSGWYTGTPVTPVPEPETYAMLLAGLGLLGFMARRRKQAAAA